MPVFTVIGALLAALGLLCGIHLLLSPLWPVPANVLTATVLFVLLSATGLGLAAMGSGDKLAADRLLRVFGGAWLGLGFLAVLGLVADLLGLVNASMTLAWWLMAGGCSAVGALAMLMGGGSAKDA